MAPSAHFNDLKNRLHDLESHMLPEIKEDLAYSTGEYDRVRSFVLLMHAEIESYMEMRVRSEIQLRVN